MKSVRLASLWAAMLSLSSVSIPVYAQRQPHTFLKNNIKLTDAEIQTIDQGQVVTKVLQSADKYGMLVFGAVYVNAPIQKFTDVFRDVREAARGEGLPGRGGVQQNRQPGQACGF